MIFCNRAITSLDNNVQNVFGHIYNRLTANSAPPLAASEPFFVLDLSLSLSLSIYHWVFVSFWQLNFCCVAFRTLCPGTRGDKAQQGCPVSSPKQNCSVPFRGGGAAGQRTLCPLHIQTSPAQILRTFATVCHGGLGWRTSSYLTQWKQMWLHWIWGFDILNNCLSRKKLNIAYFIWNMMFSFFLQTFLHLKKGWFICWHSINDALCHHALSRYDTQTCFCFFPK